MCVQPLISAYSNNHLYLKLKKNFSFLQFGLILIIIRSIDLIYKFQFLYDQQNNLLTDDFLYIIIILRF